MLTTDEKYLVTKFILLGLFGPVAPERWTEAGLMADEDLRAKLRLEQKRLVPILLDSVQQLSDKAKKTKDESDRIIAAVIETKP